MKKWWKIAFPVLCAVLLGTACSGNESLNPSDRVNNPNGGKTGNKNILMLKVDYTTHKFEGGKEFSMPDSSKEWTLSKEYVDPGDFGSIKIFYSKTQTLLFYGTIVWMGKGEIQYPTSWVKPEDFQASLATDYAYPSAGFDNLLVLPGEENPDYPSIWQGVQTLVKVKQAVYAHRDQKVKILLYTPGAGPGDPQYWKWILFMEE